MSDSKKKVTALLFMKYESERVKGKNLLSMCGQPLFFWVMNELSKSKYIDEIIVDTDSDIIATEVSKYFKVTIHHRPPEFLGNHIVANQLIECLISKFEADFYFQTHVTNPLLTVDQIDRSIDVFLNQTEHDSLFSVTEVKNRFFHADGSPVNHDPQKLIMTQNLEPMYEENSNIYMFSKQSFVENGGRIGQKPMMFPMLPEQASDIDEEIDFEWCEFRMRKRLGNEK